MTEANLTNGNTNTSKSSMLIVLTPQKVNKPAALIIGIGAMFVFGMNAATHTGGGSVIEQEVENVNPGQFESSLPLPSTA